MNLGILKKIAVAGIAILMLAALASSVGQAAAVIIEITYNACDSSQADKTEFLVTGKPYTVMNNPFIIKGLIFTGWNTKANGTGYAIEEGQVVTANGTNILIREGLVLKTNGKITLYAQWKSDMVYMTFKSGGSEKDATIGILRGRSYTTESGIFVRFNYVITGWTTPEGVTYPVGSVIKPDSDLVLTAVWEFRLEGIAIIYNACDSSQEDVRDTIYIGKPYTVINNPFTPGKGLIFTGWNSKANGTGIAVNAGQVVTLNDTGIVIREGEVLKANSGRVTLYAQWKSDMVHMIFKSGGGEKDVTVGILRGSSYTIESGIFVRPNYVITGWTTPEGVTYPVGSVIKPDSDLVLTAVWEYKSDNIAVVYNSNYSGGPMDVIIPVTKGNSHTVLNNYYSNGILFDRKEYLFTSWNKLANGKGDQYLPGAVIQNVTASITLYAQWAPAVTVTYDPNYTSDQKNVVDTLIKGASHTIRTNPFTRSDHIFAGWNTKTNGSGNPTYQPGQSIPVNSSMILYAQWTPTVTYTYKKNVGDDTSDVKEYPVKGSAYKIRSCPFVNPSYTFTGWNTQPDGKGGTAFSANQPVTANENMTLYAQWTPYQPTYTITYKANAGDSQEDVKDKCNQGSSYIVLSNTFVREGYAFTSWNTKADGTGTKVKVGESVTPTNSNYTLYAQWKPIVKIIYNSNYGGGPKDVEDIVKKGAPYTLRDDIFPRTGYAITAWTKEKNGKGDSYKPGESIPANENMTLYAQWEQTVTLTFQSNYTGGPADKVVTVIKNADYTLRNDIFLRDYYKITSWAVTPPGAYYPVGRVINPSSNTVLKATWELTTIAYKWNFTGTGGNDYVTNYLIYESTVRNGSGRTDYTFTGWNTEATGAGTLYKPGQVITVLNADITLYAQWIPGLTITFKSNYDGGPLDRTFPYYNIYDPFTIPHIGLGRQGYTQTGWTTEANGTGTTYQYGDNLYITSSLTLYAQWTPN